MSQAVSCKTRRFQPHGSPRWKNTSSDTFQQVELKFHLFDADGTMLGETVEYKDEMGPNSTWNFRAACMFTNVVRVKLADVIIR